METVPLSCGRAAPWGQPYCGVTGSILAPLPSRVPEPYCVWAGLEFFRNEWALDGPGLEFRNCMNNAAGKIIYIKPNLIVLLNTVE